MNSKDIEIENNKQFVSVMKDVSPKIFEKQEQKRKDTYIAKKKEEQNNEVQKAKQKKLVFNISAKKLFLPAIAIWGIFLILFYKLFFSENILKMPHEIFLFEILPFISIFSVLIILFIIKLIVFIISKKKEHDLIKNNTIELIYKKYEEQMRQYSNDVTERIDQYKKLFNDDADKLSLQFTKGNSVEKISKWLIKIYLDAIKEDSRASHIEELNIKIVFEVKKQKVETKRIEYTDKSYKIGKYTFDFKENRYVEISNILMQTAIAKAIVIKVQEILKVEYPIDSSGEEYKIDAIYDIDNDEVCVTLIYSAKNGAYKPEQQW